jgi:hypothetical protein
MDLRNGRRSCNNSARQDPKRESPPVTDVGIVSRPASVLTTRRAGREDAVENGACEIGDVEREDDVEEGVEEGVYHGGLDGLAGRGGGA